MNIWSCRYTFSLYEIDWIDLHSLWFSNLNWETASWDPSWATTAWTAEVSRPLVLPCKPVIKTCLRSSGSCWIRQNYSGSRTDTVPFIFHFCLLFFKSSEKRLFLPVTNTVQYQRHACTISRKFVVVHIVVALHAFLELINLKTAYFRLFTIKLCFHT